MEPAEYPKWVEVEGGEHPDYPGHQLVKDEAEEAAATGKKPKK